MSDRLELTLENVKKTLDYDPSTGKLFWRERDRSMFPCKRSYLLWNSRYSGKEAFITLDTHGYLQGCVFWKTLRAHRIVWLMCTGEWPIGQIDHINGVRTDNRFENLRLVSQRENARNQRLPSNNTSGVIGVYWRADAGKWCAKIKHEGRNIHIGFFKERDQAVEARKMKEIELGFHKNHGSQRKRVNV